MKICLTEILECLICQFEYHFNMVSYKNIQNFRILKSNFSMTWKEKRKTIQDIIRQMRQFS